MNRLIKIGIVDDHYFFRYGISQALRQFDFIDLIYNAENGQDFIEKQRSNPADIVFLDIKMPVMNGYETLMMASKEFPALKFIVLTMLDGHEYIDKILKIGVNGYLMKNTDPTELETALKLVIDGHHYYCPEVLSYLSDRLNRTYEISHKANRLTKREMEILHLIYEGYSNKEISEKLYLSSYTVKNHRYNMKKKTNAKNSAGLISYGIKNTLLM
jgi:DNA-binding NarL/FixJ family response regulator